MLGSIHKTFCSKVHSVADIVIERVDVCKLMGSYISPFLKWDDHVRTMCDEDFTLTVMRLNELMFLLH